MDSEVWNSPRVPEWNLQILGSPKGGNHSFKNREFSGILASTGAVGHVGVGFIQGTGAFLRVQRAGRLGSPGISTSRTVLVSVNWG